MEIISQRMIMRAIRQADAGPISLYCGDERVARMTCTIPHPYPPGAAAAFVDQVRAGRHRDEIWVMDASPSDGPDMVGIIAFQAQSHDISYWVGPPFWNTGLAREGVRAVCQHLQSTRGLALNATVFDDNPGSVRVLEYCGFRWIEPTRVYCIARRAEVDAARYRLDYVQ